MTVVTAQQEAFACRIAEGASRTDAYLYAYPKARMWRKANVYAEASKLAIHPKVSTRIAELRAQIAEHSVLRAVDTLREIRRIALFDLRCLFDTRGRIKHPSALDADTAAAIQSFEIRPDGTIHCRFWNKLAALDQACKILGLFERHHRQQPDPLASLLAGLNGRVVGVTASNAAVIEDEDD